MRIAVMVTYPDRSIEERDASHLWPFVPRVGDILQWTDGDKEWEQTVDQVVVHLDDSPGNADVWVGTAHVASEVAP